MINFNIREKMIYMHIISATSKKNFDYYILIYETDCETEFVLSPVPVRSPVASGRAYFWSPVRHYTSSVLRK